MLLDMKPVVYLCDVIIDVVDGEMYLGNNLYNNIYKTNKGPVTVLDNYKGITLLSVSVNYSRLV